MDNVATASINTFGSRSPKADFVPPSEEPVFILTSSQLQDLITAAVERAIQPLQDRVDALEDRRPALQDEKIAALESTTREDCAELTALQDDLKRFRVFTTPQKVEDLWAWAEELDKRTEVKPQPLQKDRGDILRALLAANGGKMLAKEARQKMRMDKATFSRLLDTLGEYVESKPFYQDKRQLVLIIK